LSRVYHLKTGLFYRPSNEDGPAVGDDGKSIMDQLVKVPRQASASLSGEEAAQIPPPTIPPTPMETDSRPADLLPEISGRSEWRIRLSVFILSDYAFISSPKMLMLRQKNSVRLNPA